MDDCARACTINYTYKVKLVNKITHAQHAPHGCSLETNAFKTCLHNLNTNDEIIKYNMTLSY